MTPPPADPTLDARIAALDTRLFDAVGHQLTPGCCRSLLALQHATRELLGDYTYLEIGSHLGGSLQTHARDPRCQRMFSIDPRPLVAPGVEGPIDYPGNSTERMRANLRPLSPTADARITTFESDAREVDPGQVTPRPQLLFIDGEHTDPAVTSDFAVCRTLAAPGAAIAFHDCGILHQGLSGIVAALDRERVAHTPLLLDGLVFVIGLDGCPVVEHPGVRALASCGRRYLSRRRWRARDRRYLGGLVGRLVLPLLRRFR